MSEKLKALVTAELFRDQLESRFGDRVEFTYDGYALDRIIMPHAQLVERIRGFDILICEYDTISKDVFDAADRLKIIICCRGGVKTVIDLEEAKRKGVIVCNNQGRNANSVTDLIMAYMLDLTRNLTVSSNALHAHAFKDYVPKMPPEYRDTVWGLDDTSPILIYRGRSINHMTLGIVGFGAIGRILARKADAFGMKIVTYSVPALKPEETPDYVTPMSFEEVLRTSDVVSVNCPLNPATRDMFGAKEFAMMKEGSYFINAARGEIVVEEALADAIRSGHLAGAALDVLRSEPMPDDSPFLDMPNVLLTPHIAGSSYDVQDCGTKMTGDNLSSYLDGTPFTMRVA